MCAFALFAAYLPSDSVLQCRQKDCKGLQYVTPGLNAGQLEAYTTLYQRYVCVSRLRSIAR